MRPNRWSQRPKLMSTDEKEGISVLTERIDNLIERLDRFEETAKTQFVTSAQFDPVQKIVYGLVGLALTAVGSGVIALVLKH